MQHYEAERAAIARQRQLVVEARRAQSSRPTPGHLWRAYDAACRSVATWRWRLDRAMQPAEEGYIA